MLQDIEEMKRRSVTADEVTQATKNGVVNYFYMPQDSGSMFSLPPNLPQFWSQKRDDFLAATIYHEDMWQSAVGVATTKMAALGFMVKSEIGLRARKGHDLLMASEAGMGWVNFISKHMQAFLLTGNGAFVEIVRATRSNGSRVLGLMHLDPHRCVRTGDPQIPVLYRDRRGAIHEMKDHQVFMLSDMPDHRELYYGVGHCAAERAYNTIYKMSAIEQFMREKVAGRKPLAIHFLSGVLKSHVDDILQSAQGEAARRGVQSYMGAAIATIAGDQPPQLVTVPLAEIPSGFVPEEERQNAYLIYARALGLDVQDIAPLSSGKGLGTATQSRVLDEKSKGMGATVAWRQAFTHMLNEFVFGEYVNFYFVEKDYRDEQNAAAVANARAQFVGSVIQSGIITAQQGLQMLVDYKDLPRDFLPSDQLAVEAYSDYERADVPFPYEAPIVEEAAAVPGVPGEALPTDAEVAEGAENLMNQVDAEQGAAVPPADGSVPPAGTPPPVAPVDPAAPAAAVPEAPSAAAVPMGTEDDDEIDEFSPESTNNNYDMSAALDDEDALAQETIGDEDDEEAIESLSQTEDEIRDSESELEMLLKAGLEDEGEGGKPKKARPKNKITKKELEFSDLGEDDLVAINKNRASQIIENVARFFKKNIALKL
jgi:hypothetical protein